VLEPQPALLVQTSVHQDPAHSPEVQSAFDAHLSPILPAPLPKKQTPSVVFSTVAPGSHVAVGLKAWHWACVEHVGKHTSRPSASGRHALGVPALLEPHPALLVHTSVHQGPWPSKPTAHLPDAQSLFKAHWSPAFPVPTPLRQIPTSGLSTVRNGSHTSVAANAWHWVCVAHVGKHSSTLVAARQAFGVPAVFEPQSALLAHTSLQK
jgi:hypothetical protein